MPDPKTVYIVDDDEGIRDGLGLLLQSISQPYKAYASAKAFLEDFEPTYIGCIILDIRMPEMTGLELQLRLTEMGSNVPIIFITGHGDIPMAVEAMRRGAYDFIRKPFDENNIIDRINQALSLHEKHEKTRQAHKDLADGLSKLSHREMQVFDAVAQGKMNKVTAHELGISERTVEVHRSSLMSKLGARSVAEIVRIKIASEMLDAP